MAQAPTIEEKYLEKVKYLEEKVKFLENENQLQKQNIKSLNEIIEVLKEKIKNLEGNNKYPSKDNKVNSLI